LVRILRLTLNLNSIGQDPAPENAGLYKCVVNNKYGEINANLSLNIEVAPVIRSVPTRHGSIKYIKAKSLTLRT
jgi:hypothetical protein